MPDGFITAAALTSANDNSWIQVAFASVLGRVGLQRILFRSLVVSIRQSFTWILTMPADNLTCATRTGLSVPSEGYGRALLSCTLSLGFIPPE